MTPQSAAVEPRVVAITGGVGGAKLVLGLDRNLPAGDLAVVVNTGDDFEHLGLSICPDLDTTLYALADLSNSDVGWGRRDETWGFMEALRGFGGETWFNLGDRDLALHVERTRKLRAGYGLDHVTRDFAASLKVNSALIPMSNEPVRTMIRTDVGTLGFQEYFVKQHCTPTVRSIYFAGAESARIDAVLSVLGSSRLEAIVICPSNPYLSIDPILAIPALRAAIAGARVPVIAVSPIIGAEAVKGPTAKIMRELGLPVSSNTIANYYGDILDGFVIDQVDAELAGSINLPVCVTGTLMCDLAHKRRLANAVMQSPVRSRDGDVARATTGLYFLPFCNPQYTVN